jgi:hypothetical protein
MEPIIDTESPKTADEPTAQNTLQLTPPFCIRTATLPPTFNAVPIWKIQTEEESPLPSRTSSVSGAILATALKQ